MLRQYRFVVFLNGICTQICRGNVSDGMVGEERQEDAGEAAGEAADVAEERCLVSQDPLYQATLHSSTVLCCDKKKSFLTPSPPNKKVIFKEAICRLCEVARKKKKL
jgi:hypothetical protein